MSKLTRSQIAKASADAQVDFCLDKQPTYEVALARRIEAAVTAPLLQRIAELERLIEEARNQALEEAANAVDAMKAPDGYGIQEQSLYDVATMEAADVVRALKGAKE